MNTAQPEVNFVIYITRVLKQIHPDLGITKNAAVQLNALLNVVGTSIAKKASFLCGNEMTRDELRQKKGAGTCDSRSIQAGVRLVLPGELARHAVSDATKAVTKYSSAPKGKGSRADKAGLVFSVARAEKLIRNHHCGRVGGGASVYLAAVLEYLSAEFMELAGRSALDHKHLRINVRDLQLIARNDNELNKLLYVLGGWDWMGGGALPNIHTALLPKLKEKY